MSVNRYRPHLLVIPEDDANRQIANGFVQDDRIDPRAAQVLPPVGGWTHVIDGFLGRAKTMATFPGQRVVLLIDFDEQDRLDDRAYRYVPGAPMMSLGCVVKAPRWEGGRGDKGPRPLYLRS